MMHIFMSRSSDPNTVGHRLHRIERLTGRPLGDPRSSAELFVAPGGAAHAARAGNYA
jgi:hypothetical protein